MHKEQLIGKIIYSDHKSKTIYLVEADGIDSIFPVNLLTVENNLSDKDKRNPTNLLGKIVIFTIFTTDGIHRSVDFLEIPVFASPTNQGLCMSCLGMPKTTIPEECVNGIIRGITQQCVRCGEKQHVCECCGIVIL